MIPPSGCLGGPTLAGEQWSLAPHTLLSSQGDLPPATPCLELSNHEALIRRPQTGGETVQLRLHLASSLGWPQRIWGNAC